MACRPATAAIVMQHADMHGLVPLRDDVAENCGKLRFRWLEFVDHHHSALVRSVRRQIKARPNTRGVGLWPDAETEKIAERCAEIFEGRIGGMTLNLIPEDPMSMIDALSVGLDLQDMHALIDIEDEFRCALDDCYHDMTFGEFVAQVKATAGTRPPRDIKAERIGCLLVLLKFVGLVVAFLALGVAANLVGKSNVFPVGVGFGTLVACWLVSLVAYRFAKRTCLLLSQLPLAIFFALVLYFALPWDLIDLWAQQHWN